MARTDDLSTDDKFELLINALMSRQEQGISADTLKELLASNATAMKKALKPENETAPLVSAMSYPEGDTAKPRANILTKELLYNGFPMHKFPEACHWWELELAEQVQPGVYRVIRKDGTDMTVEVKGEFSASGKLTRISVEFPINREEKTLIPPVPVLLYQLLHNADPRRAFVEAMHKYLDVMMAQTA